MIERRWTTFYLFAWAICSFIVLSFYSPVWFHHQLLISIPAAMLAGIAVGEALRSLPGFIRSPSYYLNQRALLVVFSVTALLFTLIPRLPLTLSDFERPYFLAAKEARDPWLEQVFLTKMANHAPETRWVVTTLPIYAFRAGLPVPPFLAVSSAKRMAGGELSEEQIIAIINEYQPEQVLLREAEFPFLEAHLKEDYRLLITDQKKQLYLRKDLKRP